jgi:hypothetical protein
MELELPAKGPLMFKQKRELSYTPLAVVNADKLLADATKQQVVKDARAALELPAEGPFTFKQKRELWYSGTGLEISLALIPLQSVP